MSEVLVALRAVTKVYRLGEVDVLALAGVDLEVPKGDFASLMGPSGSGKSTLLQLCGLLDRPSSGEIIWDGQEASAFREDHRADLRGKHIGFVFQTFNLVPTLSALLNVEFPLIFQGVPGRRRRARAKDLLTRLGLAERMQHRPDQLSGGQQQRVALARALAADPELVLADEPTGNLDSHAGKEIMEIFRLLREEGRTILMVTHDPDVASFSHRILRMRDGLLEDAA